MFKKDLKARLQRIFGIAKVSYNAPDYDAPEQDCVFVEITDVRPRMSAMNGGRETARVTGAALVFSQAERTPFGFFAKKLEQATPADKANLFFEPEQDVANSPARLVNIHERRVPFLFLYDSQYDPDRGELTSLETNLTIEGFQTFTGSGSSDDTVDSGGPEDESEDTLEGGSP